LAGGAAVEVRARHQCRCRSHPRHHAAAVTAEPGRRGDRMNRRTFSMVIAGAAAWPIVAHAQRNERVRRVGVIMGFAEDDEVWQAYLATFRRELQELGWTDGRNIRFDYRFAGESEERMRSMAEDIVALAPDVIFVSTNSVVSATLKATRSIPVV